MMRAVMLREMSADEFLDWLAFYKIEESQDSPTAAEPSGPRQLTAEAFRAFAGRHNRKF